MRLVPAESRSRKWFIVAAVVLVVLPLSAVGLWQLAGSRSFQFFGGLTSSVDTQAKVVALTFDDGPDPAGTQGLLEVLRAKDVRATFYLTGRELKAQPELGRAIAGAGHEIGNHSYSHRRMVLVSPDEVAEEVERTDELIRRTGYAGEITFRPPHGKKLLALPRYLSKHDRKTVMWDVEPDSGTPGTADELTKRTVAEVRPGSIVLLHGMYGSREATRQALGPIIDGLRERGYRFATVSELLALGPAR